MSMNPLENEKEIRKRENEGLAGLQSERIDKETGFHQQVLFAGCTVLGLAATLGIEGSGDCVGVVLEAFLYILLPLSILLELTVLWWSKRSATLLECLAKAAVQMRREGKRVGTPFVKKPTIVKAAERLGVGLFVASLVLLAVLKLLPLVC